MSDATNIDDLKRRMDGAISSFKHELTGLRTGRASASLLEPITVEAYGSSVPLNQVANITESSLGLNPITDGTTLRIPLPELNEERRKELVKIAHQYAEQARVAVRHVRRDGMESLKKAEKDSEISQDESRIASDKIQKLTDGTIAEVDKILAAKQAEIMQV